MMDDNDTRIVISELRKIRDGVETIASVLAAGTMGVILFGGFLFPRPEGLYAMVSFVACLTFGGYIANGIRNR